MPVADEPTGTGLRVHFTPLQLLLQIAPPLIWFYFLFGTWNPGTAMLLAPPTLYCLVLLPWRLYRRQFRYLLRPLLTLLLGATLIAMVNYYEWRSRLYVDALAQTMQAQCNRDGHCALPAGDWKPRYSEEHSFITHSPGMVPFPVVLTFYTGASEPAPCNPAPVQCPRQAPQASSAATMAGAPSRFIRFRFMRYLTDFSHGASGGVGRQLQY